MTLSATSPFHFWDSRYGPIPIIGGLPAHTRNSAAAWVDQSGVLQDAIINTPRFQFDTLLGERKSVLRLERAVTNVASDFGSWTLDSPGTRTAGARDPKGGTSAFTLGSPTPGGAAHVTVAYTGNASKVFWLAFQYNGASESGFGVWDNTASVWRHRAKITWTAGVPTLSTEAGAGTLYPVIRMGSGWHVCALAANGVIAANTNQIFVYPAGAAGIASGNVNVYRPVTADTPYPSSLVAPGTTRAVDQFSWDHFTPPQGVMIYTRGIDRGSGLDASTNPREWQIGKSDNSGPWLGVFHSATHYQLQFLNGSSVSSTMAASPASVPSSNTSRSSTRRIGPLNSCSRSMARPRRPEVAAQRVLHLPAAWSDTKFWLNSIGATGPGLMDYDAIKMVAFADVVAASTQGRMDELRAFEMNAAGEVIVTGS
jgi:hypothetical protein